MAGQLMTIRLARHDAQPWGFRLQGGKDFGTPLVVQKVNGGSLSEQAGLIAGDALINVNNVDVFSMTHKNAQDLIVRSGNNFDITIQRGGSVWRPHVTPTGQMPSPASHHGNHIPTVTQTSLAYSKPQEVRHIGSGYNNAARPFSSVNGNDGQVKSIVNKQYNTPVGIYSEEAIAETLSAQAEVLAGGVLGVNFKKNEKIYNAANSEVLKMLHEQENDNEPENQPRPQSPVTKHVIAPIDRPKAPNTGGLPAGQNICAECERLIVGVFVRIKDKNLHSECFKCATCGTNLKNQGYFNFNNKLYCDIHARLAAINNPPKGTEGYAPVPVKPATKLSANTISAALDAYSHLNGSSNVNTSFGGPKPFNNSPMNPQMRGPQSPSTYPPPTSAQLWDTPKPQPKPQMNPYATLPRTGPSQDVVDHSNSHPRPYTPSLINKPAPVIPYYQTPDKLCFEECSATSAREYDPRSPSPYPDRARSPAPGPPPNPLSAIRAPRIKESAELTPASYRPPIQTGSITTGQSYFGTQQAQYQTQEHGNVVSHYQTGYQAGSQTFTDKPEVYQKTQIGDTTIQSRSKESQVNEENRSALETKSTTQIGNMQIERRRKVVEEFEHTQKAKTVEIRRTTGGETQQITQSQPIGRTGFVANQARRLSNLEQEVSSLSVQSKAISERAAMLGAVSPTFPRYKSPEPVSSFPIKIDLPTYDEPTRPTYVVSASATNKMVGMPASEKASADATLAPYTPPYATLSSQQQQYRSNVQGQSISTGAAKSAMTKVSSSVSSSAAASVSASAAYSTDISKLTTTSSAAIPVPAFKAPTPYISAGGPSAGQLLTNAGQQQAPALPQPQPTTNNVAYKPATPAAAVQPSMQAPPPQITSNNVPNVVNDPSPASAGPTGKGGAFGATSAPKRGRGILNKAVGPGARVPICGCCHTQIRGPFITALGRIWCPEHFMCVNANCRRPLQDIGFVEEKGDLYCEFCFEKYLAPTCNKCNTKIKGDCLNAIGKHYHPECFTCSYCGKLFGNSPFFLEEGEPYCEADWNELFTTKCFACGFPVEAGDRWVEALNHNYHSQCFNCTMCKKNLEGQSFYNKGGRPFCKNHAR